MVTRPAEPEPPQEGDEADTGAANPSRLPVEPEFGPQPPAAEPEDPIAKQPPI
jgi:hypothetical protein